ncbi:DUF3369 domain-containing protein [Aestuariibacter sp. AA17]|uniref:DUF3369 domain-containing protein n=1 Tax=Fluctibacter corallii TaxID=2984329 RepID=A0ABT3A6Y2_9ALTE|nr:DUF3369 domain-containing protein [Aestuariibacter sp. AA17]MCV2884319.1 DUF3369 domain-containing protein [Aestuariibacter sp. AA17]
MNDFLFADEEEESESECLGTWKILIVDDEPEVHNITKLVLNDFQFEGGNLEVASAYSAEEARKYLLSDNGKHVAVAIVDVVMESNHAGLELVQWIREELNNHNIRLVLRTGQPGEAPEESVIRNYDINDYKNKTELTALKLKTLFYSALRGYRDILIIERHKHGLERIIEAMSEFVACDTVTQFASTILKQVALILGIESNDIICCAATRKESNSQANIDILAINTPNTKVMPDAGMSAIPKHIQTALDNALKRKESVFEDDHFIGYFTTKRGSETLLYVSQDRELIPIQHHLLEYFASNIAVAHENIQLREMIKESQKELSYVIGEAVEMRSKETGSHVKRVAHSSYLLAKLYGLSEYDAEMLKLASPLHDVGKVGIPDGILNKPGKHDDDEWRIMRTHAEIGYSMLSKSDNPILQLGATIAHQHHERWDGKGYPRGLEKEDIDIAGRITALADVYDALGSKRCYKSPWPHEKIVDLIAKERGKHFEPELVDIMLDNINIFQQLRERYPDPEDYAH